MTRKIIMDCDPGHDDAIAMILAAANPDLEILAITTVHGNIGIENTTTNALRVCDVIGLDVPVAQGASRPLIGEPIVAEEIHGKSGLDGPNLPDQPSRQVCGAFGPDLIVETVMNSDQPVTLVPTGPLTNIGLALAKEPRLKDKVQEIVLMGGGTYGNWTPAAEFNIYVDPEAARLVFESGIPITQCGLDVTQQTRATPDKIEAVSQIDNPVAEFVTELLREFSANYIEYYGSEGAPLHDACAIAYLIKPDLFESIHTNVVVETHAEFARGMTLVDSFGHSGREANVNFVTKVDKDGFYDLLIEALKTYSN